MIKVGISCYKLEEASENEMAGIGRHLFKLLEEISIKPELQKEFRFYLYFKSRIPDILFLNNPIFIKKVAKLPFFLPFLRPSFNIYFHIALPIYCLIDRVAVTFFPSFMLPAFFLGKSIVVLTNDVYYEYKYGDLPLRYKISYMLFSNWAARRASMITAYTNFAKKEIKKYFRMKDERIEVVPLGIDTDYIKSFLEKNPIPKENLLLYVGQGFPRRHLKETIFAFEKVSAKLNNFNFVIIGKDKYNPPIIEKLIKKTNERLGRRAIVHFNSVKEKELLEFYHKAKVLVYVSSCEAMGLPPIEALAAKTAPIVADNGLTREIFGENAFFVEDPKNIDSFSDKIEEAFTNSQKYNQIIENQMMILSKYTWQKHLDQMLNLFRVQ